MVASKAGSSGVDSTPPESTSGGPTAKRREFTPEQEVAARTTDTDAESSKRFIKVFTILKAVPLTDELHDANRVQVAREMINRGLRVPDEKSEVTFDGSEDAPDGESVYLTYSVPALPAGRLPEDAPANRAQVKPAEQPDDPSV